jgi:hypothetical protein
VERLHLWRVGRPVPSELYDQRTGGQRIVHDGDGACYEFDNERDDLRQHGSPSLPRLRSAGDPRLV